MRLLGIPTVLDRMIQQAIAQILTPIFEAWFSEHSHGFRPGRKAHDAVRNAGRYIEEGYTWVIDIDLEKYFDRVNHDILMSRIARKVKDKRLLKLIRKYLESGVMINGVVIETEEGTPQGGPLSPLLSDIMLDDLDKELEKRGLRFEKDSPMTVTSTLKPKEQENGFTKASRLFWKPKLKLKVNEAKSAVDRPWNRKFLGFSFYRIKEKIGIRLAPKTIKRIKAKVREITKRNRGISIQAVIKRLNEYLQGALGYYALADMKGFLKDLSGWIQRKLRVIIWKQCKRTKTRFKELRKLGLSIEATKKIVSSRKGYWRLVKTPQLHKVTGTAYFKSLGLVNLVERYSLIRQG